MKAEAIRGRFKDAPWFPKENEISVVVGGAGGIGSWLSFLTARAGFMPMIYDFDIVEVHNMGGQLFSKNHVGMNKGEAISQLIKDFSDVEIMTFNEKFDINSMSHQFMFGAFDNMQARKDMFEIWWRDNSENPDAILIDDRLKSIGPWRQKGGIGILHTDANETIRQLKRLGL